ncbi:MAG: hypothetical protein ABSG98_07175 [Anaerolineales bacterium]|jgi:hypothetical protein
MYHEDAEMLFPLRVSHSLRDLRGISWRRLVDRLSRLEEDNPDALAFALMMIRLDGCMTCQADSYRAMRGCTACARQAVLRFRGTDQELVKLYERARKDILVFLEDRPVSATKR